MVSKNIANIQIQHEWHWILDYYHLPVVCVVDQISSLHSGITNHEQIECIPISMGSYSCWSDISFTNSKVNYFGVSSLPVLMFEMVSVQFFSNLIGFMFFLSKQKQMVQWTLTWIQVFNAGVYLYCLSREILRVHVPQQMHSLWRNWFCICGHHMSAI